jgi:Lrp/AsnC family leucine-responsive transcriptional regulator
MIFYGRSNLSLLFLRILTMNETDSKVIEHLMRDGRMTWAELASILALSAPAAADRVHRLEQRGVIRGYAALIEPEAIGCALTAFIAVTLERPTHRRGFLQRVQELPEIQECHHIAGEDDYLLKVRCASPRELERIVSEEIKGMDGIARTRTTIVLSTSKETPVLPLKQKTDSGQ